MTDAFEDAIKRKAMREQEEHDNEIVHLTLLLNKAKNANEEQKQKLESLLKEFPNDEELLSQTKEGSGRSDYIPSCEAMFLFRDKAFEWLKKVEELLQK